jgi:hypothetical protein
MPFIRGRYHNAPPTQEQIQEQSPVAPGKLAMRLARKARELQDGMQSRVKRLPDIADLAAAFERILEEEKQRGTLPNPI